MDYHESQMNEGFQKSLSGSEVNVPQAVPTVFKWENGGNTVYLSGSFNDWKARIPLHYRYIRCTNLQKNLINNSTWLMSRNYFIQRVSGNRRDNIDCITHIFLMCSHQW